ncbi:nuclear transport factor 2 family protein [Glycomyces tarimensis]
MRPSNPIVAALIDAVNAGDRTAYFDLVTGDAALTDDGSERDLAEWSETNLFEANARLTPTRESMGGSRLIVEVHDDKWGEMTTYWDFTVDGDKIGRIDTGQAAAIGET